MTDSIVVEMHKEEKNMKLNWKTFLVALSSVGALVVMTAAVVVSQGPQQGTGGPPPRGEGG